MSVAFTKEDSAETASEIGLGVTLPLLSSATGHIFLAYGSSRLIRDRVESELAEQQLAEIPGIPRDHATLAELQRHIRRQKYATVDGRIFPGYSALSVPILNWQEEAAAAITITSRDTALLGAEGPIHKFMMNVADEISLRGPIPA
nr:C570 [uncultured bacterium]